MRAAEAAATATALGLSVAMGGARNRQQRAQQRQHQRSVRLINGTLGGSVSARVANGGLARPARSLVLRGPGRRRLGQGEQGAG